MILERALDIVNERDASYGNAEQTFGQVATAFAVLTGLEFTSSHVALVQILLKLVRAQHSPDKLDHFLDIAGYTELMARINCK